jgi:RimJ/RimL family protein N-acetyltransferase
MSKIDYFALTEALTRVRSLRVALRPVGLADAYPLYHATRNPKFNQHLLWDQPDTQDEVLARVDAIIQAASTGRLAAFSAVAAETGEWIALYRFQPHPLWQDAAEVGIWTHDRFWHGRYSLEIMRLCFSAAFSLASLQAIVAAADVSNRASCKLMADSGMRRTRFFASRDEAGRARESVEYRVTAHEWAALEPLPYIAWDLAGSTQGPATELLEQLRQGRSLPAPAKVLPLRQPLANIG